MRAELINRELRHDLRNQLFALKTAFATIAHNAQVSDRLERSLRLCSGALDRLGSAMHEYIALHTGEQTGVEIDLGRIAEEAAEALKPAADALGVKFHLELGAVKARGRALLLAMGFKRMISTAMALAAPPGEITIIMHVHEGRCRMEISYPPRPQLAQSVIEESRSSLAFAQEVVELHGGKLQRQAGRLMAQLPVSA